MISIIVPVYNVEAYVDDCLQSLAQQSRDDFELIIVDDGSTDSSMERVETWLDRFSGVRVIRKKNGGLSSARNAGLRAASKDYVLFLDSDDLLAPDAVEIISGSLEAQELDMVLYAGKVFRDPEYKGNQHSGVTYRRKAYKFQEPLNGSECLRRAMAENVYLPSACLYAFKKSLLGNLRFIDGIIHEDNHFTPALMVGASRVKVIDDELYRRRLREGSIMTATRTQANIAGYLRVAEELINLAGAKRERGSQILCKLASTNLFHAVRIAIKLGDKTTSSETFHAVKVQAKRIPAGSRDWRLRLIMAAPIIYQAWDTARANKS